MKYFLLIGIILCLTIAATSKRNKIIYHPDQKVADLVSATVFYRDYERAEDNKKFVINDDIAHTIATPLNDSVTMYYDVFTSHTFTKTRKTDGFKFWFQTTVGPSAFSFSGNASLSLNRGDTIIVAGAQYNNSFCQLTNMRQILIQNSGLVWYTGSGAISLSGDSACRFSGSGSGGVVGAGAQAGGHTFGFLMSTTAGGADCIGTGGNFADDTIEYVKIQDATKNMFDNQGIITWNGNSNTKRYLRDEFRYLWWSNSHGFQNGTNGDLSNTWDSIGIHHLQIDSTAVIVWGAWNGIYHSDVGYIEITAMTPSLPFDNIDNGFFFLSQTGGGDKFHDIRRHGANWDWLMRAVLQCENDHASFYVYNVINDGNYTYGGFDIRWADTTFYAATSFVKWTVPDSCYFYNISDGNQSNDNGYITSHIYYGGAGSYTYVTNPVFACWNLYNYNHHQYDGFNDSIGIFNFGGAGGNLIYVGTTLYTANPISSGALVDTTTTWRAAQGGPLVNTGQNTPIAQGVDIYGVPSSSLKGAANFSAFTNPNFIRHKYPHVPIYQ